MGLRNSSSEYGSLAKVLHWLIAIGIFYLIYLGLEQAGLEKGPEKTAIRATHASWALLVLGLMTVRMIWRFMNWTWMEMACTSGSLNRACSRTSMVKQEHIR